ncbi:hypothetical protein CBOM_00651 [Ceraceosorus bombacis]|uniref:Uncharacterized protein n=1 Tax=Ceraceosorus bombacis TaxID=401625 RepID=A0A0P1BBF4_9BASI|nr:hypothetical protein CBOM_00651 [Ceraceosorus bombacis]
MDDVLEAEDEMPHGPDSESEGSAEVDPIEEARGVDPERFGYPRPRSENAFENSAKPRRPASLFARALQTSSPSGTLRGSMRPASAAGGKRSNSVRSHSMRGRPPRESGSAKTNRTSNFTLGDASISSQQPRVFHSASQIQPPEVSDEDPYEDPEDREARLAAQIADRARSLKTVSAAPSSTVKGGAGGGGRAGSIRTLKGATSRSNIGSPAVEPTREADWFGSTRSRLRMPPTSPWAEDEVGSDSYVGDDLKAEGQGQEAQSELELLSEREDSAHLPRSASNNSLSGGEGSLATLEPEPMDPRSNTYKSHVYRHRIGGVYRPGYGSETASVSGSYSGTSDSRSRSSAWNRSSNVSQSGWGVAPSLSTAPTSTHPTGNMSNEHVGDVSHGSTIRGVSSLNAAGAGGRRSPAGPPGHRMTIDASRHLADLVTSNHTLSPYTRTLDTRGFTVRSAPVTPGGSGSSTPVTGASSAAHAGTAPLSMQQVQSQRLARMGSYDSQSDSHDAAAAAQRPGPPRRRRTFKLGASTQDAPHASDAKVALSDQRRSSYPAQDARSTASAPQTAAQARPNWQRSESGNSTRLASPAMQMQEDGNRPGLDRHRSFRPPSEAARAAASRWTAIRE